MTWQKIYIGSDHAGFDLKQQVIDWLATHHPSCMVTDLGTTSTESTDYPTYAQRVAEAVTLGPEAAGILICGTGIGMSIAANRHKGIRAAVGFDATWVDWARRHNDINVICFGARMQTVEAITAALACFLATPFEGGRHSRRVAMLDH